MSYVIRKVGTDTFLNGWSVKFVPFSSASRYNVLEVAEDIADQLRKQGHDVTIEATAGYCPNCREPVNGPHTCPNRWEVREEGRDEWIVVTATEPHTAAERFFQQLDADNGQLGEGGHAEVKRAGAPDQTAQLYKVAGTMIPVYTAIPF